VGIVGPKTLAKINELLTEGTGASGKVPPGLMRALGIQTKLVATTTTPPTVLPPVPAPTSTLIVPTTTTTATTTEAVATTTAAYVPPVTTPSTGQTTAPAAPAAPATVSSQSPIFTITSPNGGEGWTVGETKAITWTAGGVSVSTVNVELLKSGSYIGMLGYNVANTGSLNWTIASSVAAGSDYKVKIYNPSSLYYTYFDESDSSFSIVVPADTTPPGAPASIGASASTSTKIYLQWETSIDNVGVSGYKIYRDGSYLTSVAPLSYANSFTDTGLSPSTTYSYTVAAYDAAGNTSPQSSAASATTQSAVMPPAAPSDFNLTSNNGLALGLRWVDNSGDETEFRMERRSRPNYDNEVGASPWAEIGSVAANTTTYTDSNFPAAGIYDYRVKACNSAGCSAVSTSVNGMLMQKSAFAPAEKNLASIMYSLSEILLKLQGLLR
ncbi:MAG: Ser-Thr-rich GPI-anchored membrane family protein, partial [Candidatus Wolfebacteria bacterium]|nr:Ser-Thr-rich GPI-anchored membrane family protein [Candidatus Wolfebacteria bacterium]